jgi:hypothetical protein
MRENALRQEISVSGFAVQDSASSRRSTVMQLYLRKRRQPADIRVTRRRSDLSRPSPQPLADLKEHFLSFAQAAGAAFL